MTSTQANGWLLCGAALNCGLALLVEANGELLRVFVLALFTCAATSVVGLAMVVMGSAKVGAWLVLVSSIVFVPLGMVALVGARRVLEAIWRREFAERESR